MNLRPTSEESPTGEVLFARFEGHLKGRMARRWNELTSDERGAWDCLAAELASKDSGVPEDAR